MLIAGTSGSGKSWSTRALLAEASEREDHRLVVIDPKRVEAINWNHRARIAVTGDEVLDVSDELLEEMHDRLLEVPRGRDTIEVSARRPRITVFVDEGAEVLAMARKKGYQRVLENFRTIARMARAAEIILIWATQKPTMDRNGGIDPQIAAQITYRAALALATAGESRVVFGEDATEQGWHAHKLPMPGVAMLRHGPKAPTHPIRTRAFSPADVIALPDRPAWEIDGAAVPAPAPPPGRPKLTLVKDTQLEADLPAGRSAAAEVPAPRAEAAPAAPDSVDAKVWQAIQLLTPPVRQKDVVEASGVPKGSVSKAVKRLIESGHLLKHEDGTITIKAGEVSA
jgi:S-DNA-T family DNA segregation ATPase FtsK/SpoIIIE